MKLPIIIIIPQEGSWNIQIFVLLHYRDHDQLPNIHITPLEGSWNYQIFILLH